MKLGYLKSPPEKVGYGHPVGLLRLAPDVLPPSASVELAPCLDQTDQDCTANSFGLGLQTEMGKRPDGSWHEVPARRFLYALSRSVAGIPLTEDGGSYIWATAEACGKVGFPPESAWPYTSPLASAPDWAAYHSAADQRLLKGAYRITSIGTQRVRDVRAALAAGKVVVWGTQLDQAFVDLTGGHVWPGVRGPVIGGHAMLLHAYRTNSAQRVEFSTRSSWGAGWCENGSAWIDQDAVSSPEADDFWILDVTVPTYSEEPAAAPEVTS